MHTLPLPSKQRANGKVIQIHGRTILKEITNATYLAEGIEALYTMAKEMMPHEVGVPMGEVNMVVFQEGNREAFRIHHRSAKRLHLCNLKSWLRTLIH